VHGGLPQEPGRSRPGGPPRPPDGNGKLQFESEERIDLEADWLGW
jgi:hypothetical protein